MPEAAGRDDASLAVSPPRLAAFARLQLRHRRRRQQAIGEELFGDPAWDMLLDLFIASVEGRSTAVKALVAAAGAAESTALRWISIMVEGGVFERSPDPTDGRRSFVSLSAAAYANMIGLLSGWYRETAGLFDNLRP